MQQFNEFTPNSRKDWRSWLEEYSAYTKGVYLIYYKKHTKIPSLTWEEAVEEALCFGWIDSTINSIDENRYRQRFTPRNPKSKWSKINKESAQRLETQGLMTDKGREVINIAKTNGAWSAHDDCYNFIIPNDLSIELFSNRLLENFSSLKKSKKLYFLIQLSEKKREESRSIYINQIIKFLQNKTTI